MAQRWGWWGSVVFATATFTAAGCGDPAVNSIVGPGPEPAMVLPIKDAGAGTRDVVLDSSKAPLDMILPIKAD